MDSRYFLLIVAGLTALVSAQEPLVTISNGPILGAVHTTETNTTFYGFHGIPFARPPVNELRFMSPQPPDPWTDILNATVDRSSCVGDTYSWNSANEHEDCLYLNVYTPDLAPVKSLPVMIWFYPGGFVFGNASFNWAGPHYIMEHQNVIFVSVNYRLGPFGYLSTNDSSIPGNAGWKDMVMAIEWIYDNIAAFGGDPEKITLFGCSAGAASTGLLTTNKRVKGKFRAAIQLSGSGFAIWTLNNDPTFYLKQFLINLNQSHLINDTEQAKTLLQGLTVDELMAVYPVASFPVPYAYPVLEQESDDAFYTQYHYEQFKTGNYTQVPTMMSVTSGEFLYFLENRDKAVAYAKKLDDDPTILVPTNLETDETNYDAVISDIKSIYLEDNETWAENLVAFGDYFSDHYMRKAVFKLADLQSQYKDVYLHVFDYYGGRILAPAYVEGGSKASHAADLPYVLYMYPFISSNETDLLIQRRLTTLYTNFAVHLNPTPEPIELLQNVTWPKYTADDRHYLYIDENIDVQTNFRQDAYDAWTKIYETYEDTITTY